LTLAGLAVGVEASVSEEASTDIEKKLPVTSKDKKQSSSYDSTVDECTNLQLGGDC
jgi:hypothetical protein